jgi:hypothetical protein
VQLGEQVVAYASFPVSYNVRGTHGYPPEAVVHRDVRATSRDP